jgi:two-component system, OmpR family, sensor kinase
MSLRLRFALLAGLAVFLVVALFGTGVYVVVAMRLFDSVDSTLGQYANFVQNRLLRPIPSPAESAEASPLPHLPTDPNAFAIVYEGVGNPTMSSPNASGLSLKIPPSAWAAAERGQSRVVTVAGPGERYRIRVGPAPPADDGQSRVLVVGEWLQTLDTTLALLRLVLIAGGGLALVIAGLLGWIVAGRSLRPVTTLTRAAEQLGASGDLSHRLPQPATYDEIGRLTATFNASLDRLETVYQALEEALVQQRQFVADASHELRTPLTVILSDAETLLHHPDIPDDERRECLEELVYETKRMAALSADLLQLARGEGDAPLDVGDLNWGAFFGEVSHDATRICSPREVHVERSGQLGDGSGDEAALRRAFRIFLDNISRHTPTKTVATLRAEALDGRIRFDISDTGPGVNPHDLPRIFDRFFRADPARRGRGAGLGLAIAKSIVERHSGEIDARTGEGGGFTVRVYLPRYQPSEPSAAETSTPALT